MKVSKHLIDSRFFVSIIAVLVSGCSDRVIVENQSGDLVVEVSSSSGASSKNYMAGGYTEVRKLPHTCEDIITISIDYPNDLEEKISAKACSTTSDSRVSRVIVYPNHEVSYLPRRGR